MKHFLAYGNSDQANFRHPDVRKSMDFLTVPGTIAAYYPDATAAFVLSSALDYIIDPRTPLFQEKIDEPRPSHYELARHLGTAIQAELGDPDLRRPAVFAPTLWTDEDLADLTMSVIRFQGEYGGRAAHIQDRLSRYERLLRQASPRNVAARAVPMTRPPTLVLAPYFVIKSLDDPWSDINARIWRHCRGAADHARISPVVAVESPRVLGAALGLVPDGMSPHRFFWVTTLDERRSSEGELRSVWEAVSHSANLSLINLYGGFFSICLHHAGLWGFNNGLGYSEARKWPELAATGAAPARYYVRALHAFFSLRVAQLFVDTAPTLACNCAVCGPKDGRVVNLQFHELKRHFALARRWEREQVMTRSPADLADVLEEARSHFETKCVGPHPEPPCARSQLPVQVGNYSANGSVGEHL